MVLRFGDALRLSTANILEHKGRTAATVLTIAVLFGFLMGVNFLLNGLAGTMYDAAVEQTEGLAYVKVAYASGGGKWRFNEKEELDLDRIIMNENARARIAERVAKNDGEIVGRTWTYQVDYPYDIVELAVVKNLVTGDLTKVPEGKIPVLVPEDGWQWESLAGSGEYEEMIAEDLYEVGIMPSTRKGGLDTENLKLLKPLVEQFRGNSGGFLVVDDGSGRVEEFLYQKSKEYVGEGGAESTEPGEEEMEDDYYALPSIGVIGQYEVAAFDKMEDMVDCVLPKTVAGVTFYGDGYKFYMQDLTSNAVSVIQAAASYKSIIKFLEIVMLVVGVIVATLTFVHLVDQDAATVALYRSLGATTGQIYIIYFLYMVEMCLLAVIVCFLMAFAMTGIVALVDRRALGVALESYYFLNEAPAVRLFRFDKDFWTVIVAIMLVAVLGFGFSTGRFSNKNIAKKLKEDQ